MTLVDFLLFMFFSVIESSAVFYMMFKVFKIDIYPIHIIFAGLIMGFISFEIRTVYQISGIDIFMQMFLTFAFVWLMFRIHVFYSLILTQMSYLAYFIIQTTYYFLFQALGLFDSDIPQVLNISTYIMQTTSALTTVCIAWIVVKKRKGFDFVPDKPNEKITYKARDKVLFISSIFSSLLILLTIYFALMFNKFIIISPFLYALILAWYLYYSYKKDRGEDEHNRV